MVHAFEPWAPVRAQLVKNASLNAGARIVVHPFGLADVNENRPFHASLGGNQGIGAFEGGYTGRTRPWPTRCRRAAATMSWPKAWRRRPAGSRSMSRATSRWSSRGLAATLAKHRPLVALEYPEAGRGLYPQGRSPLSLMPENICSTSSSTVAGGALVPSKPDSMLSPEVVLVPEELKSVAG